MLVKLGSVWVDPVLVASIRDTSTVPENSPEYTGQIVAKITLNVGDGIVHSTLFTITEEKIFKADDFAAIVNEALAPKQSWGEDISEPEE